MEWYVWLGIGVASALFIAVLPIRIGVYAAFSLFDGRVGVRLGVWHLPVFRLWCDLTLGVLQVNGKPRPFSAGDKEEGAGTILSATAVALRALAGVRYAFGIDLLVGTYDPAHSWLPLAVCDALPLPHVEVRAYAASSQVCKGVLRGKISLHLWDVVRFTRAVRTYAT